MAGKREENKERTRRAILEAAVSLFTKQGYEQTSIADLARTAGIGKGTVYSYFRKKSDIFLAFCEQQLEEVTAAILRTDTPEMTLVSRLLVVYQQEFLFIAKNPEFGRLLMCETYFPRSDATALPRAFEDRYIAVLRPVLLQGQQRGELRRDIELTFVLGHIYGLYCIVVSAWFTGRLKTKEDVLLVLEGLLQQAMQGLAPQ